MRIKPSDLDQTFSRGYNQLEVVKLIEEIAGRSVRMGMRHINGALPIVIPDGPQVLLGLDGKIERL